MHLKPPITAYGVMCIASAALLLLSGCMSLFHPQAKEWYRQAKGAIPQQTVLNLIALMEPTAQRAKAESGEGSALHDLHHQFHALHTTWDDFSGQQTAVTAYEHALTLHQELQTIFHRLWELQGNASLRRIHIDLFLSRLQELRQIVQAIPA